MYDPPACAILSDMSSRRVQKGRFGGYDIEGGGARIRPQGWSLILAKQSRRGPDVVRVVEGASPGVDEGWPGKGGQLTTAWELARPRMQCLVDWLGQRRTWPRKGDVQRSRALRKRRRAYQA